MTAPSNDPLVCGLTQRILHVHVGLGCNLHCQHCYSSSGPAMKTRLDARVALDALADARALGYEVAAFSGGEPTLHPGLAEMLGTAKAHGFRTVLTTNGTTLTTATTALLQRHADLVAVSVDGPPAIHNRLRRSPTAFTRMEDGLQRLRDAGVPFGLIVTLTEETWEHLVWAAEFAEAQGGKLLQIHPLEQAGRGSNLATLAPSSETLGKACLLALAIQQRYENRLRVQLDVFPKDYLTDHPESVYATAAPSQPCPQPPASLLNLLVLEADGTAVPFAYGLSRAFQIGNLNSSRLTQAFPEFLEQRYPALLQLCQRVFLEQVVPHDFPLLNWYELLAQESHAHKRALAGAPPSV